METDRRKFLGSFSLGTAALFGSNLSITGNDSIIQHPGKSIFSSGKPGTFIPGSEGINPRDVKINVKVVYYAMIHPGIWHGPCRYSTDKSRRGKEGGKEKF